MLTFRGGRGLIREGGLIERGVNRDFTVLDFIRRVKSCYSEMTQFKRTTYDQLLRKITFTIDTSNLLVVCINTAGATCNCIKL